MAEQPQHDVTAAHTVRAERFELVDAAGALRATLTTDQNGQVSLTLFDQDARSRAALVADRARAGLYLFTPSGATALLVATSGRVALVTLNDDAGRPAVVLSVLWDGRRVVSLCENGGAQHVWLGLDEEVYPEIVLQPTADNTNRVVLTVQPGSDAGLTIRDREGSTRAMFSVDGRGQAGLALLDPHERPIARLELTHDEGPRLDFFQFGPHQGLSWRAPDDS